MTQKTFSDKEAIEIKKKIETYAVEIDWESVSRYMISKGYKRSSKECEKYWVNKKSADKGKNKWTLDDNIDLFNQFDMYGKSWIQIASKFKNRDNKSIKNQFFNLVRKSLRNMSKFLDLDFNTHDIIRINTKVLINIMSKDHELGKMHDSIKNFVILPYAELLKTVTPEEKEKLKEFLNYIVHFDATVLQNNKRIKKNMGKKKFETMNNFLSNVSNEDSDLLVSQKSKKHIDSRPNFNVENNLEGLEHLTSTNVNQILSLFDQIKEKKPIDNKTFKDLLVHFFAKIANLSHNMKFVIEKRICEAMKSNSRQELNKPVKPNDQNRSLNNISPLKSNIDADIFYEDNRSNISLVGIQKKEFSMFEDPLGYVNHESNNLYFDSNTIKDKAEFEKNGNVSKNINDVDYINLSPVTTNKNQHNNKTTETNKTNFDNTIDEIIKMIDEYKYDKVNKFK